MINRLKIGLFILIIAYNLINSQKIAFAAPTSCSSKNVSLASSSIPTAAVPFNASTMSFTFTGLPDNTQKYYINFQDNSNAISPSVIPVGFQATLTVSNIGNLGIGSHEGWLYTGDSTGSHSEFCSGINITIVNTCSMTYSPNPALSGQNISVYMTKTPPGNYIMLLDNKNVNATTSKGSGVTIDASGNGSAQIGPYDISLIGSHTLSLTYDRGGVIEPFCNTTFIINNPSNPNPVPGGGGAAGTSIPCKGSSCTGGAGIICDPNNPSLTTVPPDAHGIRTALGCISTDPQTFISTILKWVLGFAGGVALLLMILGAFQMVTSSGNPDALKSGQEQFSAALIGLVFVLLSVTLLEIIGVDILQIPGLVR